MAYVSFQPNANFNTTLYAGDSDASGHAITGVGFQPDVVWIKTRDEAQNHGLNDSVRGVLNLIEPDTTAAPDTASTGLSAFGADGFTVKNMGQINASGNNYVSWNWRMGTTSGIDTTGATFTPTGYSFNAAAGQSIIEYTGNITAPNSIPHGLGTVPHFILTKPLHGTYGWGVYHRWMNVGVDPEDYGMKLETSAVQDNSDGYWNDTAPTSVLVNLGNTDRTNSSGANIAYCFTEVAGYSCFTKYKARGSADGNFIYLGFRPAWLMIKSTTSTQGWKIFDDKRNGYNVANSQLTADTNSVEADMPIDILSNGFKIRTTDTAINTENINYLVAAFAEFPLVASNNIPTVAR